jgi:hypothetical protein
VFRLKKAYALARGDLGGRVAGFNVELVKLALGRFGWAGELGRGRETGPRHQAGSSEKIKGLLSFCADTGHIQVDQSGGFA